MLSHMALLAAQWQTTQELHDSMMRVCMFWRPGHLACIEGAQQGVIFINHRLGDYLKLVRVPRVAKGWDANTIPAEEISIEMDGNVLSRCMDLPSIQMTVIHARQACCQPGEIIEFMQTKTITITVLPCNRTVSMTSDSVYGSCICALVYGKWKHLSA